MEIVEIKDGFKRMQIGTLDGRKYVSPFYMDAEYSMQLDEKNITATGKDAYDRLLDEMNIDKSEIIFWSEKLYHNDNTFYVTDHALERLRERYNWNKKTALRMLEKIFEKGQRAVDRKDHVASWARYREKEDNFRTKIYTYGDCAIVVSIENVIITAYDVPNKAAGREFFMRHGLKEHDEVMKQKKKMNRRVPRNKMPIPLYAS